MRERWLPIPEWEGFYEVSDLGRVRSVPRVITQTMRGRRVRVRLTGKVLRPAVKKSRSGAPYSVVTLSDTSRGRRRVAVIYRLVLETFVGPRPPGLEACHANDIGTDNRLVNLRWDTRQANALDQVANGRHNHARQETCPAGHPYSHRNARQRLCRTCRNAQSSARYHARKAAK